MYFTNEEIRMANEHKIVSNSGNANLDNEMPLASLTLEILSVLKWEELAPCTLLAGRPRLGEQPGAFLQVKHALTR